MSHARLRPSPSFLAAVLVLGPAVCVAQIASLPEGQSSTPQPTGTCRITGQVVAADNGAPVRGAGVLLSGQATVAAGAGGRGVTSITSIQTAPSGAAAGGSGVVFGAAQYPPGYVRQQAETDQAGRFEFTDLPAGRFSVMTSPRSGFVPAQASQQVQLSDGQSMAVTIRLQRTGAIAGRVLDEGGEPLARAQVRALRRDTYSGNVASGGIGAHATTDDLGQFRLYDLQPGDYFVVGTGFSQPSFGTGPRTGYGPTYYPGALDIGAARQVPVRSGQDTSGIEFALQRVALGRISGVLTDSTGRPASPGSGVGISVMLSRRGAEYDGSSHGSALRPDGNFLINDIAPGHYYLSATIAHGQGPDAEREGAFVPVTVNGDDLAVNIQTNTGATILGRVIVEGSQQPPVASPAGTIVPPVPPRVLIAMRPAQENRVPGTDVSGRPSQAGDDGTFHLTGARGGPFFFTATGGRAILKSVLRGGEDITTKPLTLNGTERVTDIVIVMTTDTGRVQGTVTNAQGEPAPGMDVIMFPEDSDRWFAGSPFVSRTRSYSAPVSTGGTLPAMSAAPAASALSASPAAPPSPAVFRLGPGRFSLPFVLPGRYYIVALDTGNAVSGISRELLEKLRPTATDVTVTAGEPTTVQLRVAK